MNNAMTDQIHPTSKPISKWKKRRLYLLGSLILTPLAIYLIAHIDREIALAGTCLTALAGMCFIAALTIIHTSAAVLKRAKETQTTFRAVPSEVYCDNIQA